MRETSVLALKMSRYTALTLIYLKKMMLEKKNQTEEVLTSSIFIIGTYKYFCLNTQIK